MLHTARPADNDSVGRASGAKAKDNARVSEPEVFRASFGGSKFMQEDWNRRVSDMQKNGGPDAAAITGRARFEARRLPRPRGVRRRWREDTGGLTCRGRLI